MHILETLLPFTNHVILKFTVRILLIYKVTPLARSVSYILFPRLGSKVWSTLAACSNQMVRTFGNDWNTYLFPLASERR